VADGGQTKRHFFSSEHKRVRIKEEGERKKSRKKYRRRTTDIKL
jgi:hypothetical protein